MGCLGGNVIFVNMKECMQLMTIDDLKGHWKSKYGCGYLVIDKENNLVQLYVDRKLVINETLSFEYIHEDEERNLCNVWVISESILLWMISPDDGNVILKINEDKVEFTR